MSGVSGAEGADQRVLLAQGLDVSEGKERDGEMDSDGLAGSEGHKGAGELAPVVALVGRGHCLLQMRKLGKPALARIYP